MPKGGRKLATASGTVDAEVTAANVVGAGVDATAMDGGALELFHPVTATWFRAVFEGVTAPQREGWPAISRGESTLILAPTGTGKTLTAFLWCLDRLMLQRPVETGAAEGCRVVYISPLKALAVDVERNLRSPLAGIANMAQRDGVPVHVPTISVRTGDTPQKERAQFNRHPGEILITTPESLYLMLTSNAGNALRSVETVIIDEIHALVPTKRGAHMMLSLERLEALVAASGGGKIQRIGLSATQRPLEEVARFLGGAEGQGPGDREQGSGKSKTQIPFGNDKPKSDEVEVGVRYRPVTIVNAGARKVLELKVEVPVEDMAKLGEIEELPSGAASQGPKRTSIWQSIHPRLLEIIRERTSTLIFVNARRVAERLAGAINELAGESIARAHHGSLAAAQRSEIEELLKAGKLRALVCTSSLELGIDMGAVDLVIQIEAPPSVASGMQRIGRAGHQVGAPSTGIIFPKYRADLIACAAVTQAMHEGHVESTRFLRNPLDVLAQQIVACVSHPPEAEQGVGKAVAGRKAGVEKQILRSAQDDNVVGLASEVEKQILRSAQDDNVVGLASEVEKQILRSAQDDNVVGLAPEVEKQVLRSAQDDDVVGLASEVEKQILRSAQDDNVVRLAPEVEKQVLRLRPAASAQDDNVVRLALGVEKQILRSAQDDNVVGLASEVEKQILGSAQDDNVVGLASEVEKQILRSAQDDNVVRLALGVEKQVLRLRPAASAQDDNVVRLALGVEKQILRSAQDDNVVGLASEVEKQILGSAQDDNVVGLASEVEKQILRSAQDDNVVRLALGVEKQVLRLRPAASAQDDNVVRLALGVEKQVLGSAQDDKFGVEDEDGGGISYDALFGLVRSAAPFAGMSATAFNGVLDMLAGRYPSDEFAELRPRVTWDRDKNWITPRQGVKRIAILNGGTIPDRGTYGVFLSGATKPLRVGELDEEMVFEARTGETFVLGASTWRIDEITQDRVLVSPAPGEPGKMPFWHGDRPGRPIEFGRRIGALVRELRAMPRNIAMTKLVADHDLDEKAAENVLRYLVDQELATEQVPDDRTIVIERVRDELGDWRVCVLTPLGSRVHTPWAMAVSAKLKAAGLDVETMWSEDGFVLRFPESDVPPDVDVLMMSPLEANELVLAQLGSTALFAAKFREASSRALLLPRRRADGRTPLWQQRKRAYDLLSVASRYAEFPMLLEAYRECLRDVFDMPALMEVLRGIETRTTRVHVVDSRTPSPFASALLFSYVANYIYDGDAPLAERRAQALAIDQDQLRELLGDADLRELLDAAAIEETEEQLQCVVEGYRARNMDGVHDLLLRLGDLTRAEIALRAAGDAEEVSGWIARLIKARRALELMVAGERRVIAVEDVARVRDALGVPLPPGLPAAFLEAVPDALLDIVRRYARTHGPFTTADVAGRYALAKESVEATLQRLVGLGRVVEGGFRPGGLNREWIDAEVLRTVRRKSLAKLRKEIEPVAQRTLARLFTRWQGVVQPRRGLDALLDTIENLQGAPLPASLLETEILPARVAGYRSSDLDTLIAAGEVVWVGLEPLGERDGRVGLYLAEKVQTLWPVQGAKAEPLSEKESRIVEWLKARGASFFQDLHDGVGGGYPGETLEALWSLVWRGMLMNDGMLSLRAYCEKPAGGRAKPAARRVHNQAGFRSRRTTPPTAQGRWSLNAVAFEEGRDVTKWSAAIAQQLLTRYGVVFRETAHAEGLPGGFSAVYDVMKALEESGKVRRGYFAADLGATQFAMPAAVDLLRSLRTGAQEDSQEVVMLAATDPANPYGALLRWPAAPEEGSSLTRSVGARVVLVNGALSAYLRRGNPAIQVMIPEEEPGCSQVSRALAEFFVMQVRRDEAGGSAQARAGMLITMVNGMVVAEHPLGRYLLEAGFFAAPMGFNVRKGLPGLP